MPAINATKKISLVAWSNHLTSFRARFSKLAAGILGKRDGPFLDCSTSARVHLTRFYQPVEIPAKFAHICNRYMLICSP
jgi:hypothetical protein